MAFELFTRVALCEDFPQYKLHRGDLACIVEHHPVPMSGDVRSLVSLVAFGDWGPTVEQRVACQRSLNMITITVNDHVN